MTRPCAYCGQSWIDAYARLKSTIVTTKDESYYYFAKDGTGFQTWVYGNGDLTLCPRCINNDSRRRENLTIKKKNEFWGGNGLVVVERRSDSIPNTDRDAERLVTADTQIIFIREFVAVLYEAGGLVTLSRAVQECTRSQYLV